MRTPPRLDPDRLAFLALGVALLGLGLASWRPIPAGVWHDDGVYLLVAKALAEGEGLRYAGVPGDIPALKFPPLYPGLLAGLWLVFGSVGSVTAAAVVLNLAFLAMAGVLMAVALRRSAGVDVMTSVGAAGLAFLAAHVWRVGLVALSEPLFVLLTCAALATWSAASRPGDRRGAAALSALLTAAVLTRSAGMALVVGFAVALLRARGLRTSLAVTAPPVLASVAWGAWTAARTELIPGPMRDLLGPYGSFLLRQSLQDPGDVFSGLSTHALSFVELSFGLMLPGVTGPALFAAAVVLSGPIAFGLACLHGRLPPLTWTVGAYVAMLLLWPYIDWRLVVPLHPLLLVAGAIGGLELWRLSASGMRRGAVAVGLAAWAALYTGGSLWRAADGWTTSAYELRATRLTAAVEALARTAAPTAVVGAPEFWAALHLHGGWQVSPSALFVPRLLQDGLPGWGTPEEQIALWRAAGIDHVLLEGPAIHAPTLDLVEERCPGAVAILATMPPQMLVRIGWDEACERAFGS